MLNVAPAAGDTATVTVNGGVTGTVNVSGDATVTVTGTVTGNVTATGANASVTAGSITGSQTANGGATISTGENTVTLRADYTVSNDTNAYTISLDTTVSGNTITVSGNAPSGATVSLYVTPASGVAYVVNGQAYTTAETFTVTLGQQFTVTAGSGSNAKTYNITISSQ